MLDETDIGCSEYQKVRDPTSRASHHPNISSASSIRHAAWQTHCSLLFSFFMYLFQILSLCLYLSHCLLFPPIILQLFQFQLFSSQKTTIFHLYFVSLHLFLSCSLTLLGSSLPRFILCFIGNKKLKHFCIVKDVTV